MVINRSRIVHMLARGKAALRIAATFGNKREVLIGELGVGGMSSSFFCRIRA